MMNQKHEQQRRFVSSMPSSSSSSPPRTATSTKLSVLFQRIFTPHRIRVWKKIGTGGLVASIPVVIWWKWAVDQRQHRADEIRSKVRLPSNVQSIDDMMLEQCRPGDVVLFDRRWEHCATGPLAALVCMLGRAFLCKEDPNKVLPDGKFDHCGKRISGLYTIFGFFLGHDKISDSLFLLQVW
jgi:hypothetical protein